MKFASLANPQDIVSFETAVSRGIPADGSLYFPVEIPELSIAELDAVKGKTPAEVAYSVLRPWLHDEMSEHDLRAIIAQACTFPTPIRNVGDKRILELFHGPTAAFKDVAARYLAAFMGYYNSKSGRNTTVLVATSGDTGGAIAQGFAGVAGTRVVVLFPRGRVSQLQREQLTRVADNVVSYEVSGTFDDCQDLVKQAFSDPSLDNLNLTSANSISMGRLLPQMTYYAVAALQEPGRRFVVPSGNLGNLTAGVMARAMGLPIPKFLAANNVNNLLYRYLRDEKAEVRPTQQTFANAMDVGRPNNMPRLVRLFDGDRNKLAAAVGGASISDEIIAKTIKSVWAEHNYLLDPHTAVAWAASTSFSDPDVSDILVATAAPFKFSREIRQETGIVVSNHELLAELRSRPARVRPLKSNYVEFQNALRDLDSRN